MVRERIDHGGGGPASATALLLGFSSSSARGRP
jgi:hypothetical protein